MLMVEQLVEEVRSLSELELQETLDFLLVLKAKRSIPTFQPRINGEDLNEEEAHWVEVK